MRTNLTEKEIDQGYEYAKNSFDPDGLRQVCMALARECLRLRRVNDLLKRELAGGPVEPITMPSLLDGATPADGGADPWSN